MRQYAMASASSLSYLPFRGNKRTRSGPVGSTSFRAAESHGKNNTETRPLDPITAIANALAAGANAAAECAKLETASIQAMTPVQAEKYLQAKVDIVGNVAAGVKVFQDMTTQLLAMLNSLHLAHPQAVQVPAKA